MSDEKRVLPADVYDALELSALAFGGVGAGSFGQHADARSSNSRWENEPDGKPCCIHGHAIAVVGSHFNEVRNTLLALRINTEANDNAVSVINRRLGNRQGFERVTFADWCAELGVERGA